MRVLSYITAIIAAVLMVYGLYIVFTTPDTVSDKEFFVVLISSFTMYFVAFLFDNLALTVYSSEMRRRRRLGIWNAILGTGTCLGVLVWILIEL